MNRSMKSILLAIMAYDSAIVIFCLSIGLSVTVDAIWSTPRFRSTVAMIAAIQMLLVIASLTGLHFIRGKSHSLWNIATLFLSHVMLALSAIWLSVVCKGAIWQSTMP